MSDTTAFLSGCAITGVAAVFLLGGGLAGQYRGVQQAPIQQVPTVAELPPVPVPSVPPISSYPDPDRQLLQNELSQQKTAADELKRQVDDLKAQLERQQTDTQQLLTQLQEQQRTMQTMTAELEASRRSQGTALFEQPQRSQALILGAVGVTLLIVLAGGGMILIGILVLIVQSQRKQSRSMHVIQPIPQPYTFPHQEFLPPQRTRRTRQIDYYDYDE